MRFLFINKISAYLIISYHINVFEQIIHNQCNNNNLFATPQLECHKFHSTEYAALKLIDHVSRQICNLAIQIAIFL